jgi:hypothetical protein
MGIRTGIGVRPESVSAAGIGIRTSYGEIGVRIIRRVDREPKARRSPPTRGTDRSGPVGAVTTRANSEARWKGHPLVLARPLLKTWLRIGGTPPGEPQE